MYPPDPVTDTLVSFLASVDALEAILPNRFTDPIRSACTTRALYDASLPLRYAANAKQLRDTDDQRVHDLCEEIRRHHRALDALLRIKLFPESPPQRQEWETAILRVPGGKYAFRDDGSLEISLLDAALRGATLHVKRVWHHVCNYDGAWIAFAINLTDAQREQFQSALAACGALQVALEVLHGARP